MYSFIYCKHVCKLHTDSWPRQNVLAHGDRYKCSCNSDDTSATWVFAFNKSRNGNLHGDVFLSLLYSNTQLSKISDVPVCAPKKKKMFSICDLPLVQLHDSYMDAIGWLLTAQISPWSFHFLVILYHFFLFIKEFSTSFYHFWCIFWMKVKIFRMRFYAFIDVIVNALKSLMSYIWQCFHSTCYNIHFPYVFTHVPCMLLCCFSSLPHNVLLPLPNCSKINFILYH